MNKKNSGVSLPEVMIVSALILISLGAILQTYLATERYLQAGTFQVMAQGYARKAMRKISNDIRGSQDITLYANYGPAPTPATSGNYITIDFSSGSDVGYYRNNNGEIRYIDNLTTDITTIESDDEVIARYVTGNNIFSTSSGLVTLNFSSDCSTSIIPGRQAVDVRTKVVPRN